MSLNIGKIENFENRHNGPKPTDVKQMLDAIGCTTIDELIHKTVPDNIRMSGDLKIDKSLSEEQYLASLKTIAAKNKVFKSYIGMGYYNTHTPKVILRNVMENPGWYTQYTPYQAEIAQGRLEAVLNYQTMVSDLTGLELTNASLLDEGTAAAEAMSMFHNLCKRKDAHTFFVDNSVFPQTIDVLKTRATPLGIELVFGDYKTVSLDDSYFGALVQFPNADGSIEDYTGFASDLASNGILLAVAADLLSLTLLKAPGVWGADAVLGNTQRFGVPLGYGGPHAAYFATKEEFKRHVPGRIIGVSKDANGNKALRMALQTREQHIKRARATSNICTAQVLLAIMAGMYGVYHGPDGLIKISSKIHGLTKALNNSLANANYVQTNKYFFDTLNIKLEDATHRFKIEALALENGINFQYDNHNIRVSIDETTDLEDIKVIAKCFGAELILADYEDLEADFPTSVKRSTEFMTHPVFHKYHIEHEMLRYLKRLENKDLSLTHSMISLGSCTMKLNATTEMIPVTWPEFNSIHPFVPLDQVAGYAEVIEKFSKDLVEITGFDAMTLQPNAGAQGEYAGLMIIRAYLADTGEGHRNIALIPSSAHGTNPASAVMAGMKVVVVKCLDNGYIDMGDLRAKSEKHKDNLACFMVTYPSTYGLFEETIIEITETIHNCGGQVYMDGANMNAQVGLTSPGRIGADVCHLNLHKTFCIPHGGGGPGMGPVGVAKHLTPYLPSHSVVKIGSEKAMGAVSAAPYGSANIILISYGYIKLMGASGLRKATEIAILNANYIMSKLKGHYEMLFSGKNGTVAHEMIIDTRLFKAETGVQAEDIAKRLMDYGYHAPTMSFPIPGTMMIEPTESESKEELDRFCEALISIREEIKDIAEGRMSKEDNPLINAPHTAETLLADNWEHPYSRKQAAYPLSWVTERKFWPSVSRVDNTYGDRNLICSCPPTEAYETAEV